MFARALKCMLFMGLLVGVQGAFAADALPEDLQPGAASQIPSAFSAFSVSCILEGPIQERSRDFQEIGIAFVSAQMSVVAGHGELVLEASPVHNAKRALLPDRLPLEGDLEIYEESGRTTFALLDDDTFLSIEYSQSGALAQGRLVVFEDYEFDVQCIVTTVR